MANFCSAGRDSMHATTRWWVSASATSSNSSAAFRSMASSGITSEIRARRSRARKASMHERHEQGVDAATTTVDTRRLPPQGQESFLYRVFGGGSVGKNSIGESERSSADQRVQGVYRTRITGAQACREAIGLFATNVRWSCAPCSLGSGVSFWRGNSSDG
jgi:hypothetical protein